METALDKQCKQTPTNIFNQENPSESLYMGALFVIAHCEDNEKTYILTNV